MKLRDVFKPGTYRWPHGSDDWPPGGGGSLTQNLNVGGGVDRHVEVDSTGGAYAVLQADSAGGRVILSDAAGNNDLVLFRDPDGDLAIQGVGKIAIQP